jgi:hypothetical protein
MSITDPPLPDHGDAAEAKLRRREGLDTNQVGSHMVPDIEKYNHIAHQAHLIFVERNRARQSAFRQAGWKGQLVEMRKKLDRLWSIWGARSPEPKDIDEALDLINAAIFFIMLAEEDEPNGRWPWP